MTRAKKLKKAIRARAGKTGESYTAARRQVLAAKARRAGAGAAAPAAATPPARPQRLTRSRSVTSDRAVRLKTGHGFDHWFAVLDAFGAAARGHTASARHLGEEHGLPGWHCQMITVEYERARGLRATNQSCKGDFQVSVSRTVPATLARVARSLSDVGERRLWLRAADAPLARALEAALAGENPRSLKLRKPDRAALRFPWDGSTVEVFLVAKPNGKVSVVAQNSRLNGPEQVEQRRAQWAAALDGLKAHLAG